MVIDSPFLPVASQRPRRSAAHRVLRRRPPCLPTCWRPVFCFPTHLPFFFLVLRSLGSGASGVPPGLIVYLGPSSLCHVSAAVLGIPELGSAVT